MKHSKCVSREPRNVKLLFDKSLVFPFLLLSHIDIWLGVVPGVTPELPGAIPALNLFGCGKLGILGSTLRASSKGRWMTSVEVR